MARTTEDLVKRYFSLGLQQSEILHFLKAFHGINISIRTLKRILSKCRLFRRKNYSSLNEVVEYIQNELNSSGQLHGYRWMHLKCIQKGFIVTQDVVRELLKILDPTGVQQRQRKRLRRRQYSNKGPNYLWHIDSYDKLKPYGICINGCIDGFSRHIIWLQANVTSNDPKVIAGYYLKAIKYLQGCPLSVRSDMGTENCLIERFQTALRELSTVNYNSSSRPPFLYGKSTGNQRIEAWWSILRKQKSQYWINLFETLRDDGHFNGTFLDKSLIQFCFLELIQNELDEMVFEWNTHKIQKARNSNSPTGKPVIMYEIPSLYNAENYIVNIPSILCDYLEEECSFFNLTCDEDVFNVCSEVMSEHGYVKTTDPYETVQLYLKLRRHINSLLMHGI